MALPALIGPAVKVGAALFGGLFGGGASREEKDVLRNNARAQQIGMNAGTQLLAQGHQALDPVGNYWNGIMSGNRSAVTSAAMPELLQIGDSYNAAARTSAELNPRGGPSASFLAELPFQKHRDVSTTLAKSRREAAGEAGTVGSNLLSNAINAIYGSTAAGRDILRSKEQQRAQSAQRGEEMGSVIFDAINQYGWDNIGNDILGLFRRGGKMSTPTPVSMLSDRSTG